MKAVMAGLVIALSVASPAFAQDEPRVSVAGGYAFFREQGPGGLDPATYPIGWVATGGWRIGSSRLVAVGEVGMSLRQNVFDETQRVLGVLGGGRYALTRSARMTTFAQALVGIERFSEPGFTESGFAVQPGAGVDLKIGSRVFLRAQGDYRMSRPNGDTFHDARVFIGIGVGR